MKNSIPRSHRYSVAVFVSPHGFGHAARASSVMQAVHDIQPGVSFEVFTTVPPWFFEASLTAPFSYHELVTDIGMVQHSPLQEDLSMTIDRLNRFLPLEPCLIDRLAQQLSDLGCRLVICDIAPMGILAGRQAGIPSILVENFTWDWIYQGYLNRSKRMGKHVDYLRRIFDAADHHIQTEPVCERRKADLITPPACRKTRTSRSEIRRQLGVPANKKVVLITMGGIEVRFDFAHALRDQPDVTFVLPGANRSTKSTGNLVLLPHHSDFFHPDLVNASDGIIGKLGYSTVAEVYHAGVPFGYVPRRHFPESAILADYVDRKIPSLSIDEAGFHTGRWASQIPKLLALKQKKPTLPNGSEPIADYIRRLLQQMGAVSERLLP
jgi:hypothetical protein